MLTQEQDRHPPEARPRRRGDRFPFQVRRLSDLGVFRDERVVGGGVGEHELDGDTLAVKPRRVGERRVVHALPLVGGEVGVHGPQAAVEIDLEVEAVLLAQFEPLDDGEHHGGVRRGSETGAYDLFCAERAPRSGEGMT